MSKDSKPFGTAAANYLNETFSLQGRSCIVTGGGTGIGKALSLGLARAGAKVVLTGRREGVLQEATKDIQRKLVENDGEGGEKEKSTFYIPCDITSYDTLDNLTKEAEELTGIPPTILVNNAGINVRQKAEDLTAKHFQTSLDLMLTAPFMLTRSLAKNMQKQQHGRIVNIASLQSYSAFPDSIPYAAAKSGTLGLTRAIAEAYSAPRGYPNVTCNAIAPGYVKTDLTKSVFEDEERSQRLADATIVGRNSVPEDLVGAVLFLCSPAANYVTGQTIPVDGGFSALGLR